MVPIVETELDRRQRERVQQSKRERDSTADGESKPKVPPASDGKRRVAAASGRSDRWATYNAFVDVISPRLTLAERAVWHVMFRHTRNGVCETTVRMLASGAAVSRSTAEAALRRLVTSGLVWAIWKSKDKAKASKYGIHAHPDACLSRVMARGEPSRSP